jgi:hypothetical protein
MDILVGYTGFVGSNLKNKHHFDLLCNSANITEAFGTQPDLLVYSGIPAEMYLANSNPAADLLICKNAAENIRKIAPKKLVLISTIAVLDNPNGTDEDVSINATNLPPYGANRFALEQLAGEIVPDHHIIRLAALFGEGLKKNFIYDFIHFVPPLLNKAKYEELAAQEVLIGTSYRLAENGFYLLHGKNAELKAAFERVGFSALSFTDSRSQFQFYNLAHLWEHIKIAIKNDIRLLNLATEPISAGEVYRYLTGADFVNEKANPLYHDFRTKYAGLFGGDNGYILKKEIILEEIKAYIGLHNARVQFPILKMVSL